MPLFRGAASTIALDLAYPGTATISDSTISGNSAGVVGGGVFSIISGDAAFTIVNSIVAGNLGPEGSPSDIPGGSMSLQATFRVT